MHSHSSSHGMPSTDPSTDNIIEYHLQGRILRVDVGYLRSKYGIIKVVEILLSLFALILSASTHGVQGERLWACFVSFFGFIGTFTFLFAYLFELNKAIDKLPWTPIQIVYYSIMSFFYFLAAIFVALFCAAFWSERRSHYATVASFATVVLFICMFIFGIDLFFQFKQWRSIMTNNNNSRQHFPAAAMVQSAHTNPKSSMLHNHN